MKRVRRNAREIKRTVKLKKGHGGKGSQEGERGKSAGMGAWGC